jgi:hypothetical protein
MEGGKMLKLQNLSEKYPLTSGDGYTGSAYHSLSPDACTQVGMKLAIFSSVGESKDLS